MKASLSIVFLFVALAGFTQGLTVEIPTEYATDEKALFLERDRSGFLKIATNRGMHTHYGTSSDFTSFEELPTYWLESNWIGTQEGKLYRPQNKAIQVTDSTSISCLLRHDDKIYIGTEGEGLFLLDTQNDSLKSIPLSDPFIYDLAASENEIYIATDRGIEVYDPKKDEVGVKLNSTITTELCIWDGQLVASVYGKGLLSYTLKGEEEKIELRGEPLKLLVEKDRLFILTDQGVFEKHKNSAPELLFASEEIIDLAYLDEEGLAFLHDDGKLTFFDLRFSVFHETAGAAITALARNGSDLFLAHDGMITAIPLSGNTEPKSFAFPGSQDFVNMVASVDKLFAGTFDRGLFSVDLSSGKILNYGETDGLLDNSVLGMARMNDTLWFSTLSGLAYLAPDGRIDYIEGINSTYIYDLLASDGILWIGTDGNGILKKEGSKISSGSEELRRTTVYRISKDAAGNFRCITKERGVYELTAKGFLRLGEAADYEGYTSFGCGPANTTLLIDEGKLILTQEGKTAVYNEQSGFGALNDAYLNTFAKPTDQEVFFASDTRVYAYRPTTNLPQVGVKLVEATSDFEPINFNGPEIDYDANNLIFKLASPWYRNPEEVEFRYRLKGLEEEFRKSKNPDLIYPHLPYGEYKLEAQAGYKGIFHGDPESLMVFTVKRPFYLNPWFILIAILLLGFIVYVIVKIRVANINRLRLAEKRMVESELAVLRTQVNPHFLFNSFNTLMSIIEPESKAGAEYLEKLSDFYRRILEENKSQVITVEEELKILDEYIFLQKKRFGEAFRMNIRLSEESKSSLIPALTFQLLAENALKHNLATRTRPLEIDIEEDAKAVVMRNPVVKKRKEAEGTGMGLENIRSRYQALFGKKIEIENDGETFTVKLPKINPDHARFNS